MNFTEIFAAVILPILPVLAAFVVAWLNKKRVEISAKIENDTANKYIRLASDAVFKAVQSTTQTYVDSLKKEGKFDVAAQRDALLKSKLLAETMITEKSREIINEAYGDFHTWLTTQIEMMVRENK